jgi:hypothetical protein
MSPSLIVVLFFVKMAKPFVKLLLPSFPDSTVVHPVDLILEPFQSNPPVRPKNLTGG